jgi:hypothetical protein
VAGVELDDATWTAATKYSGFIQRYPKDAAAPTDQRHA